MLRAHRQAWAWQDEYYGLQLSDIRRLEMETQEALAKKMGEVYEQEGTTQPKVITNSVQQDEAVTANDQEPETHSSPKRQPMASDSALLKEESSHALGGMKKSWGSRHSFGGGMYKAC